MKATLVLGSLELSKTTGGLDAANDELRKKECAQDGAKTEEKGRNPYRRYRASR
jgi:hypothetical protein